MTVYLLWYENSQCEEWLAGVFSTKDKAMEKGKRIEKWHVCRKVWITSEEVDSL